MMGKKRVGECSLLSVVIRRKGKYLCPDLSERLLITLTKDFITLETGGLFPHLTAFTAKLSVS